MDTQNSTAPAINNDAVVAPVQNSEIKVVSSASPITFDKFTVTDNQKAGTKTAQLRQVITTVSSYPSKKVTSDKQAGLFGTEAFGFGTQEFTSNEERVAWIPVPEAATEEQVIALLGEANKAGACLYRTLSSAPILDENQKWAINDPLIDQTLDKYADKQAVRYPKNDKTIADGTANKLVLHNGRPQYRRIFFWNAPMADIDNRNVDTPYASPALLAEVGGAAAFAGQKL